MKQNYIICITCGYIMRADEVHDVCPACGVSSKAFAPYKPKVNHKREQILSLHLHPIILHFPQAVVVFAFLLLALIPFFNGNWKDYIIICAKFHTFLLPLCIVGGLLSGLIDGKIRYKSALTPILKVKIIFSSIFLILAILAAVIMLVQPLTLGINLLLIIIMFANMVLGIILGRIGSRLVTPVFPG